METKVLIYSVAYVMNIHVLQAFLVLLYSLTKFREITHKTLATSRQKRVYNHIK